MPPGFSIALQLRERLDRLGEVLEHEADEDVVEGLGRERQREDVRLRGTRRCVPGGVDAPLRFGDRLGGEVDRREARLRAARGQGDGLRADAAAGLEDRLPAG